MKIITSFTKSVSDDNIVSTIYVSIGDFFFPDLNWKDFTITILNWWIEQLIGQLGGEIKGEYLFMDGPYYFESEFLDKEIKLAFKQRRLHGTDLLFSANVRKEDFIIEIKKNVNSILRECNKHHFINKDVKQLEINYQKLSNVLKEWNNPY